MMLSIDEVQKSIDSTQFWDMHILDLKILYFGDEIELIIDSDDDVCWKIEFLTCLKLSYITDADWGSGCWRGNLSVKEMIKPQMGYVGQEIAVSESESPGFYKVDMDLSIMEMHIECKEIIVSQVNKSELDLFWRNN